MNHLAQFVYQVINGDEAKQIKLSRSKEVISRELHFILQHDPDDLARMLSKPQAQAEEWLIPPPTSASIRNS